MAERAPLSDTQRGYLLGLFTVTIWGSYLAMNRYGTASGLTMADMCLLRYGPAALIMLPYFLRHQPATLGGIGWRRGLVLTMILGPSFTYLAVGGYYFAPLAHGAVFQPSGLILSGLVLGIVVLREPLTPLHMLGVAIIVGGLAVVAGPALFSGGANAWMGDCLFFLAGCSWGLYTVLSKRWATPPITATALISVLSGAVFVPLFVATETFERLAALPLPNLLSQLVIQGALSAVVATIAFTRAAQLLGASRVSAFPALVPVVAILIGVPVTGEWPTLLQAVGIVLVVTGLMTAIGAFRLRRGVRPVRVTEPDAKPALAEGGPEAR